MRTRDSGNGTHADAVGSVWQSGQPAVGWLSCLPTVPSPLEKLERAHREALEAEGGDFFRRLRDYRKLIWEEPSIAAALSALQEEADEAGERFAREDAGFVLELVEIRDELLKRAPEAAQNPPPWPLREGPITPEVADDQRDWSYTLANFEAVANDTEEKIILPSGGDRSRSRTLCAILHARIYDLRYPEENGRRPETDQREDLDDVQGKVNRIEGKVGIAYRRAEDVMEQCGSFGRIKLEEIVTHLEPREQIQMDTRERKTAAINAMFVEAMGRLNYLREATRPPEFAGSVSEEGKKALEAHEDAARKALGRLHRPLRAYLEAREAEVSGWAKLTTSEKIQIAGLVVAVFGIIVGAVVTLLVTG
jgi:hypothetical protein